MPLRLTGIIPARFLILISQLFLSIVILCSRNDNILACMYGNDSSQQYNTLNIQIIIAISISFFLFALEFIGFLTGMSLTVDWQNLISILAHSAGSITLLVYIFNNWCSNQYWYVFGFCCVLPAITEVWVWIVIYCIRRHV